MATVIYNHFHAGDTLLCRTIIGEIVELNSNRSFELQCKSRNTYLWQDLGLPITPLQDGQEIILRGEGSVNLHFAAYGDMLSRGLTYANHVETYNRQAPASGLMMIPYDGKQRFVSLPQIELPEIRQPSVLVENGPVLSGQPVLDINKHLQGLASEFHNVAFYCSHRPPNFSAHNVVDVSCWNLVRLSAWSEICTTMICRLSAVLVCSFTERNHGRPRIIFGQPLGCPIWDEEGLIYASDYEALTSSLHNLLRG